MEKYLKIIVIVGVVVLLVFVFLIVNMMMDNNQDDPSQANNPAEATYNKDDYVISQSVALYADIYASLGDGGARITGTLASINYVEDAVSSFTVVDGNDNYHEIHVSDMHLISLNAQKATADTKGEATLAYRTGGSTRLMEGYTAYMYKDQDGKYSFDERVLLGGSIESTVGKVVDFEFSPMTTQQGHILLSYIILEDASGQRVSLALSTMNTQSIQSSGEMTVYFDKDIETEYVYNVRESDNFSINIMMHDGSAYTYTRGSEIQLQKGSNKGYWELAKTIDTTPHKATVTDIIFGSKDANVASIDYIVLSMADGTQVQMTMLETQALYGIPVGNYERIYTFDVHEKVLSDIVPQEDWKMELYYPGGIVIDIRIGSHVWINKNADNLWTIDYPRTSADTQ